MSTISNYTRVMIQSFKDQVGIPTGGMSLFNGSVKYFNAEKIDIDIKRGTGRKASLVRRYEETTNLTSQSNGEKFTAISRMFPLIESVSSVSMRDLSGREFGELPQITRTVQARALSKAREIHDRHIEENAREMERLAWQSVLTGKMDVYGAGQLDFYRRASHQVIVANAWNGGSATILADITAQTKKVRADGHLNPDVMIMGEGSYEAFLADTEIKELMDKTSELNLYKLNAENSKYKRFLDNGFVPVGSIRLPATGTELFIFTYGDTYEDSLGNNVKYLADNQVVIMSSASRMDRYFGSSDIMPEVIETPKILGGNNFGLAPAYNGSKDILQGKMFFSDARGSENGKGFILRTQVAPIFAPISIDGIVVMDTLV